uniref:Uncharacterized protein n=1 Tax=Strigops habroptila TaxID=2489341 RepID=A0A672TYP7_STRHB
MKGFSTPGAGGAVAVASPRTGCTPSGPRRCGPWGKAAAPAPGASVVGPFGLPEPPSSCSPPASALSPAAWMRWCASRLAFWLKLLPHCAQGKGRSPVCTRRWCDLRPKLRPHSSQAKGRAPACALACATRLVREPKRRPHCGQAKGRSPVCTRKCRRRCWRRAKARAHCGQEKGRSPAWASWCVARLGLWLKVFSQCGQAKGFSPMCPRRSAPALAWPWGTLCDGLG